MSDVRTTPIGNYDGVARCLQVELVTHGALSIWRLPKRPRRIARAPVPEQRPPGRTKSCPELVVRYERPTVLLRSRDGRMTGELRVFGIELRAAVDIAAVRKYREVQHDPLPVDPTRVADLGSVAGDLLRVRADALQPGGRDRGDPAGTPGRSGTGAAA
ncbi:MAG TPA: hypothetical protein VF221_12590 [Chloroflexota bacterium]